LAEGIVSAGTGEKNKRCKNEEDFFMFHFQSVYIGAECREEDSLGNGACEP